jgi:ElaB/YqjD/DUF883 family membrane-anchored ribosome-binding protein
MSERSTGMSGSGATGREWTGGDGMRDRAEDMRDKAGAKVSEYGEKAAEQVEAGKGKAATGMEQAAGTLREKVAGTSGITAEAGTKVADRMDLTAGYLREHSTGEMWDEVEHYVREHPAQALAGAVFAGFLIAKVLR